MSPLGASRQGTFVQKIFFCTAIAVAGIVAGRLSIDKPSQQTLAAGKRDLAPTEKDLIAHAVSGRLKAVSFQWSPLLLLTRSGITDYCALIKGTDAHADETGFIKFYAQLLFQHMNPRDALLRVGFSLIASPDDPIARHVVNTACVEYGYGSLDDD